MRVRTIPQLVACWTTLKDLKQTHCYATLKQTYSKMLEVKRLKHDYMIVFGLWIQSSQSITRFLSLLNIQVQEISLLSLKWVLLLGFFRVKAYLFQYRHKTNKVAWTITSNKYRHLVGRWDVIQARDDIFNIQECDLVR